MPLSRLVEAWTQGWSAQASARWLAEHGLLLAAVEPTLATAVRVALEPLVEATHATNRYLIWRFQDVVDALDPIPVCALKGIALLGTTYRDQLGLRPMVDVDLLVRPEDEELALARLHAELGLSELESSVRLRGRTAHRVLGEGAFKLELHRVLSVKHGGAASWERLAPVPRELHDRLVYTLDAETTLVHLLTHLVQHGPFSRLKWVADVLLVADEPLDGARFWAVARRLGAVRSTRAALGVLARVLSMTPPLGLPSAGVWDRAAVAVVQRVLWRRLRPERLDAAAHGSRLGRLLAAVVLADRATDALRALTTKLGEVWVR